MHFLVVDPRFGTPIYVFLDSDPAGGKDYPGLAVEEIVLEVAPPGTHGRRTSVGRDPYRLARFREFASDAAVARAGFILMEPRYVGPNWEGYCRHFRPEGEKPDKHRGHAPAAARSE
jgi:hypothetical protein